MAARRYAGELGPRRPSRGSHRARVKQEEGIGERIAARGGPESSGHVAGELGLLRRGGTRGGASNLGSPVLGWDNGC